MKNEPVLSIGAIAAAVVAVLALFHVVLDTSTVETIVAVVIPLIASLIAREKVTPVAR